MSHQKNTEWVEAAHENFGEAVEAGNYSLAKGIIADMKEAGFSLDAEAMSQQLATVPVSNWKGTSAPTE